MGAALILGALLALATQGGLPDETVEHYSRLARDNLTMARLADGTNVPEETADERAVAIVPTALARQTVERGFLTAAMQVCGMDWQDESYLPYMKTLRTAGRYSSKQLAYIGFLHGIVQGHVASSASQAIDCSDSAKAGWRTMARDSQIVAP